MDWWGTQIRRPMQYPITPFPKWSARQDLHLRSLSPKPSVPPRRDYALIAPARSQRRRTGEMQDTNPDNGPAISSLKKLALPCGTCTHTLPADNPESFRG